MPQVEVIVVKNVWYVLCEEGAGDDSAGDELESSGWDRDS